MTKLLIVDDEPDVLEFLSYNFRKKNYEVVVANNGIEGMMMAVSQRPDIIIADIMMPQMNGIEMCERIRNFDSLANTPVVFLTAVNDDYKVQYAMSVGGDQFVNKPAKFEYLLEVLEHTLNSRIQRTSKE